jgi:multiple RNA-binding domain-containing protein 1
MSRLIVKNLPAYVTPARLKEHFSQKGSPAGIITDVKVSQKPDGTSRRFGFVGFKSELDAQAAQKWFDRTFIDSARITVAVSDVSSCFFVFRFFIPVFFREHKMHLRLVPTSVRD